MKHTLILLLVLAVAVSILDAKRRHNNDDGSNEGAEHDGDSTEQRGEQDSDNEEGGRRKHRFRGEDNDSKTSGRHESMKEIGKEVIKGVKTIINQTISTVKQMSKKMNQDE